MSQVIGETQTEKGESTLAKAAGVGMALMGASSLPTAEDHHVDHGHAPARAWACLISGAGWLVGGIAFPFHLWALVVIGGILQIVAIIVNLAMNAAGLGAKANRDWAAAKAQAKAARAA
jgi:hypothetical protein